MSLADLRRDYTGSRLEPRDLAPDPLTQFARWLEEALRSALPEPNAMTVATVSAEGHPSARVVLLKGVGAGGFSFYTNCESRKAREIEANPHVALVFNWLELERQVRVEGKAHKLPREASEAYFKSRPYGSQLGAWASPQSRVIPSREVLEERLEVMKATYPEGEVPLPPFWGGYRVTPQAVEFWQGRPSRLHDRFLYTRDGEAWRLERLAP